MTEETFVGKTFVIEKEKKFVHTISFKLDDAGLQKLQAAITFLGAKGKRQSNVMRSLVDRLDRHLTVHASLLKEKDGLKHRVKLLSSEKTALKHEASELQKRVGYVESKNEKLIIDLKDKDKLLAAFKEYGVKPSQVAEAKQEVKAQPSKSEAATPIPVTQKPSVAKEHNITRPQMPTPSGWIACIDDKWVTKDDCEQCRTTNFNKFSNCFNQRIKAIPNDIFFRVSTPKPSTIAFQDKQKG